MLAHSESALATACIRCGATVPIVLSATSPACRYCGSDSPIDAAVSQRVAAVRAKVMSQQARGQQLVGRQASLGRAHGVSLLIAMMALWAFIFLIGWFTFAPPEALGFIALMAGGDSLESVDIRARYWLSWISLAGVGLTTLGYGISMLSMRRLVDLALPRAPLFAGAPPRCRVCGAELGQHGRVRRCGHCAADHLVTGERYVREEARIDGELARMQRVLDATLELKVKRADQWLWVFSGLMPLISVVLVPAMALLLGAPTKGLVWLPLLPLAIGIVCVAIALSIRVPEIRTREAARPGDTLLVQGQPLQTLARLSVGLWPFSGNLFLCPRVAGGGLEGVFIGADTEPCYRVELESGGEAMRADELQSAQAAAAITPESWQKYDLHGGENLEGVLRSTTAVWYYAPRAKTPAEISGARLWFGDRPDQRQDPRPTLTIRGVTQLASDAVWLLQ